MRWMFGLLAVVATILVAAAVALIVAAGSSSTALADLELGDCFDLPVLDPAATGEDVEVVQGVDVISCDELHQAEVVLVGELNPDAELEYPTDDILFEMVDQRCVTVADLVPRGFALLPIAPIEATWDRFGGRFQCVAVPIGGAETVGALVPDPGSD